MPPIGPQPLRPSHACELPAWALSEKLTAGYALREKKFILVTT